MSNKTMTITEISKASQQFKDTHTLQVGGFKEGGGRVTALDVQKELRTSVAAILTEMRTTNNAVLNAINKINKRLDNIEQSIKQINIRIDNLVDKNDLKE